MTTVMVRSDQGNQVLPRRASVGGAPVQGGRASSPHPGLCLFSARLHQARYFDALAAHATTVKVTRVSASPRSASKPSLPTDLKPALEAVLELRQRELSMRARGRSPWTLRLDRQLQRWSAASAIRSLAIHCLASFDRSDIQMVGVWNGHQWRPSVAAAVARYLGKRTLFFENGWLPGTTQVDPRGVNAAGSLPRDPEVFRRRQRQEQAPGAALVARPSRRGPEALTSLPEHYVLVPFQIESDSQLLVHSPWIQTMDQLVEVALEAQRLAGPQAPALVFREHPSNKRSAAALRARAEAAGALFANANPMQELIAGAAGVLTINSTVGLEALLNRTPVLALGRAVYDLPGIADVAHGVDDVAAWMGAPRIQDADLLRSFLAYLQEEHLIPGDWRTPDARHLDAVLNRVHTCLSV